MLQRLSDFMAIFEVNWTLLEMILSEIFFIVWFWYRYFRGVPTRVSLRSSVTVKQVAAGSNHTVLLTANGQVYTFGSQKVRWKTWEKSSEVVFLHIISGTHK